MGRREETAAVRPERRDEAVARQTVPVSRSGPLVVLLCAGTAGLAWSRQGEDRPSRFQVIVNPSVTGAQIRREELAAIFLGDRTRWSDGTAIEAVDLSLRSDVRREFSDRVLRLSLLAVQNLWMRRITTGQQRPPLVKPSDREVIAYVAAGPGRIGYVSVSTTLPSRVKPLKVVD
jgi:hypothetical protein